MQRIALAMGGRASTIAGLSGVGDTFGTCFGPLSRNSLNTGVRFDAASALMTFSPIWVKLQAHAETAFCP